MLCFTQFIGIMSYVSCFRLILGCVDTYSCGNCFCLRILWKLCCVQLNEVTDEFMLNFVSGRNGNMELNSIAVGCLCFSYVSGF